MYIPAGVVSCGPQLILLESCSLLLLSNFAAATELATFSQFFRNPSPENVLALRQRAVSLTQESRFGTHPLLVLRFGTISSFLLHFQKCISFLSSSSLFLF